MNPRTRAATILAASALTLTACAPGWEGPGTIIELELIGHENEGHRLTDPGTLEVTVVTDSYGESAVEVNAACIRDLEIGQTITATDLEAKCGTIDHSTDD